MGETRDKQGKHGKMAATLAVAPKKYRVGVLGATGTVGQQFLKYLDDVSVDYSAEYPVLLSTCAGKTLACSTLGSKCKSWGQASDPLAQNTVQS